MKRWLMVPLAMAAVLVLTPTSEARGRKSCGSSYCGPTYCVVGYKTEQRMVTSYEWVTVKEKAKVTEYQHVKEKAKVVKYEAKHYTEKKPYSYWVCEPVTVEKDVVKWVYDRVETKKQGKRQVAKHVTEEQPYKYTVDKGHYVTQCYEQVCYSKKRCGGGCCYTQTCYKKVWVPNLVVVEGKAQVHKCIYVEEPYDYVEVSYNKKEVKDKIKVTEYVKVEKKGEHTYHFCKYEPITVEVDVTVCKPVIVEKDVEYKKCVAVQKPVEIKVPIYGCSYPTHHDGCCK